MALELTDLAIDDDELTRLALAADPDAPLPADAVPLAELLGGDGADGLLPDWYMPAPAVGAQHSGRRRRAMVGLVVLSLLVVNAVGLCVTNGGLEIAW